MGLREHRNLILNVCSGLEKSLEVVQSVSSEELQGRIMAFRESGEWI